VSKKFKKTKEDFVCGKCGTEVVGNGYTDHCPNCLWSKHVDINPGDRLSTCGGLMEPLNVEVGKGKYKVLNRCTICGYKKFNVLSDNDNWDEVTTIQDRFARKFVNSAKKFR
jgi:rubredoxin